MVTVATWSPIKATTKFITGANPAIPTNVYDVKTDLVDNFAVVEKGKFYRSAQLSANTLKSYIKEYGIKSVVNLRGKNPKASWWKKEAAVTRRSKVCFFNVPMTATKLTSRKNIKAILNIFDTAPRPILIHCQSGIDRTGEVSALWALDQQHKSHSTALAQLTLLYRYSRFANPKKVAKEFLIKKWRGRSWFEKEYNPAEFSKFEAQAD